jgi:Ca2+/H+ antiporter
VITKILFTIVVVLVVAVVFRHKNTQQSTTKRKTPTKTLIEEQTGVQPKTIVYAILGLMIVVSFLVFTLHWQSQHQIINIQVSDSTGNTTHYQAYKKSIKGRKFETLAGIQVTLGDSDRLEMNSTE